MNLVSEMSILLEDSISDFTPARVYGNAWVHTELSAAMKIMRAKLFELERQQTLAFEELPQTSLSVFLTADMPRCFGYGLASSSDLGGRPNSM